MTVTHKVRQSLSEAGLTTTGVRVLRRFAWYPYNLAYGAWHRSEEPQYGIAPGYRHRATGEYFDDTERADEWQREVYEFASAIALREWAGRMRVVYDVGCGSGYKLLKHFAAADTTGFDLEPTVNYLRATHPQRKWVVPDLSRRDIPPADIVICADVIEHLENPDELLDFLSSLMSGFLVISTPARDVLYGRSSPSYFGPPKNPAHYREWTFNEFGNYLRDSGFVIITHRITNRIQGTQMALCRLPVGR